MKQGIHGSGGGGGDGPTIHLDDLRSEDSIEILLGLAQGKIGGFYNGLKSLYIDDTPVQASNDLLNFQGMHLVLYKGDSSPTPVKMRVGGGLSSNESVGVALSQGIPVVRSSSLVDPSQVDKLQVRLLISRLVRAKDDGDQLRTSAFVDLEYREKGSVTWLPFIDSNWLTNPENIEIEGKTTNSPYVKELAREVTPSANGWEIRVTLTSPADDDPENLCDIQWESFQELITESQSYPNTAMLRMDSQMSNQFSNVPNVWGEYQGREVLVPSNYDPVNRTYSGVWDGTFVKAITDNPAWILYDLIMSPDVGLAHYNPLVTADRWDFYEVSQYCDELVNYYDAAGNLLGQQPRFTMNLVLSDVMRGKEVLDYVAGAVNAKVYDAGAGMHRIKIDRNESAHALFTRENVVNGDFSYSFSEVNSRYNQVNVAFVEPDKQFSVDRVQINDTDAQALNGIIPYDFTAVGCNNRHEAVRRGRELIISANTETRTVAFSVHRPGYLIEPMAIILIADPDMGWGLSGRIKSVAASSITLDRPLYVELPGEYTLTIQLNTDVIERQVIVNNSGLNSVLDLKAGEATLPALPALATFSLQDTSNEGTAKPFKVVGIVEDDETPELFHINAIELNRNKYGDAITGTKSDPQPYSYQSGVRPDTPTNLTLQSDRMVMLSNPDGTLVPRLLISWQQNPLTIVEEFVVRYKPSTDTRWTTIKTEDKNLYVSPVQVGVDYDVTVQTVNQLNFKSLPAAILGYTVVGEANAPTNVATLTALIQETRVSLSWTQSLRLDVRYYEVAKGLENDTWADLEFVGATDGTTLYDLDYDPTKPWYHVRILDTSDNYSTVTKTLAIADLDTAPTPSFVRLVDPIPGVGNETKFPGRDAEFECEDIKGSKYRGYKWRVYNLSNGLLYEEETVSNRFTYTWALNAARGGLRSFKVEVSLVSQNGFVSGSVVSATVSNPQIAVAPGSVVVTSGLDQVFISFAKLDEQDLDAYQIHMSETPGFTPGAGTRVYRGLNNGAALPATNGKTYYLRISAHDVFGTDNIVYSTEYNTTVVTVDQMLTLLTDQIQEAQLTQALKDPIFEAQEFVSLTQNSRFEHGKRHWSDSYSGETVADTTDGTIVTGVGVDGGSVWELPGDASSDWYYGALVPVDTARTYKLRFRVRQTVDLTNAGAGGGSKVYAGVATLDGNYQPITGGAGSHRYCAVSNTSITVADGWMVFEGTIADEGDLHENFRPGTKYVRPMFIVNYPNGNGTVQVDLCDFFDYEEVTQTNAAVEAESQTRETETGLLSAEHTIKTQVRTSDGQTVIAGIGVAVSAGGSGPTTSDIVLMSDRLAIVPPDLASTESAKIPFVVDGGVVYMNTAMIKQASIDNALIGNFIQSTNYVPGISGWRIDKTTGLVEAAGIRIYDGAGGVIMASGTGLEPDAPINGTTQKVRDLTDLNDTMTALAPMPASVTASFV